MSETAKPMPIEFIETEGRLTIQQKFRLVEIMHETKEDQVRRAAADILFLSCAPLVTFDESKIQRFGVPDPNFMRQLWGNPDPSSNAA